jgi:serine/threonine-protein kinase
MVADRYRLRRKVGGGRVAASWQVFDEVSKSLGVLKLLHRSMHNHPEALRRFSLEAQIARELTGPYFAERIDSGSWQSMRYIAWRWHQGECLRSRFERNPKQDAPTVHTIVKDVCEALSVVHSAGYAHADLKPENVFFAEGPEEPSSQLKLLGFGVAFPEEPRKGGSMRSQERRRWHIVGTPLYMSPDMLRGDVPIGTKTDLWSLGVIVYEALTGRVPFLGNDLEETLESILTRRSPKPSAVADVPVTIDQWWAQATEQEFSSAREFSSALTKALEPALRSSRTQRSKLSPRALTAEGTLLATTDAAVIRNIDSAAPAMHTEISAVRTELHAIPRVEPSPRPEPAPRLELGTQRVEQPAPRAAPVPTSRAESRPPAEAQGEFAPLPPLTDFLASSKRTLLGIKPAQLDNKPRPTQQHIDAPSNRSEAEGVMLYRNIEISEPKDGIAPANDHHTVPFPRPQFPGSRGPRLGRALDPLDEPMFDTTAARSSKTIEHLPAFLTGGERKHQWIAAAVVCSIAAAVLLLTGRPSMSEPPLIEQDKRALSAGDDDEGFMPPFAARKATEGEATETAPSPLAPSAGPADPGPAATPPSAAAASAEQKTAAAQAPAASTPRTAPVSAGTGVAAAPPRAVPPRAVPPQPAPAKPAAPAPRATQPAARPAHGKPAATEAPRPTAPKPPTTGSNRGNDPGEFDFGF